MNSPFGGTQKRPVAVNPKNKTHERQQPSTKHSQHTDTNSGPGKDCYAGTQNGGEGDTRKRTQSTRHPRPKLKMVPKTPRRFCSDPLEGRGGGGGTPRKNRSKRSGTARYYRNRAGTARIRKSGDADRHPPLSELCFE